jgi:Tol biopolymer transport system component
MTEPQPPPTARETCEMVLFRGCGLIILLVFLACSGLSMLGLPRQSRFHVASGHEVIVFASYQGGGAQLYAINPDGSGLTQLTYNLGQYYAPLWPFPLPSPYAGLAMTHYPRPAPNQAGVIYTSNFEPGPDHTRPSRWYQLRLDGSPQRRVELPLSDKPSITWSPDGAYLAYTENEQVYVTQWDGSNPRCVSCGIEHNKASGPRWSPDSTHLIITVSRGGTQFDAFIVARDGSNPRLISQIVPWMRGYQWSPDGTQLVVVGGREHSHIYTMRMDGREVRQLTTSGVNMDPAWSPDGTQIVFTSRRTKIVDHTIEPRHLSIINADGTNLRQITSGPGIRSSPVWVRMP